MKVTNYKKGKGEEWIFPLSCRGFFLVAFVVQKKYRPRYNSKFVFVYTLYKESSHQMAKEGILLNNTPAAFLYTFQPGKKITPD